MLALEQMNAELQANTYLVSGELTVADIYAYHELSTAFEVNGDLKGSVFAECKELGEWYDRVGS